MSLQHYWITPAQNHHPTDVGLILSKPIKATGSQFDVGFKMAHDHCIIQAIIYVFSGCFFASLRGLEREAGTHTGCACAT